MVTSRLNSYDPLRNFKFQVIISKQTAPQGGGDPDNVLATAGFMSVSGLGVQTEVIRYREGGMNTTFRKLPGQSDFPPITLQRGLFAGTQVAHGPAMWQWKKEIFYYLQGESDVLSEGADPNFRTDLTIRVLDHPRTASGPTEGNQNPRGTDRVAIRVYNAWPSAVIMNDLDAGSNAIMVEQVQFQHEGIEVVWDTDGQGAERLLS